ncbi:phosphotransferase [Sphaerisporangium sp. NPDC051017]|uniref:phosphotransferase n=1 Tax=Sphaerisporangium sp. NPDC051017 TaxID=3154636 RepID=UPI0034208742
MTEQPDQPPLGATAGRPPWERLPSAFRELVDDSLDSPVASAQVQQGGFTPGVAARLILTDGTRVFVKALPDDHLLAHRYRAEAATSEALPAVVPAPRLRLHRDAEGWVLLVFDDVEGRHPDLSPGSPDVPAVAAAVEAMTESLTPCPLPDVPSASTICVPMIHGWDELATDPPADLGAWERDNLPLLVELEAAWAARADGPALVHGDIRPDNLLITAHETVVVVDWAKPRRGNQWRDLTDLIPHMIMTGHAPDAAERALHGLQFWERAPAEAITGYAAAYAGFWTRMSRKPDPPGVPNLRAYQRRAAGAAIAWTRYRTGG